VVVTGADARDVGRMVAEIGLPVFEMTSDGSNLEDIFLDLTGSEAGEP